MHTLHIDARSVAAQLTKTPDQMLENHLVLTPTSTGAIADCYPQGARSPFQAIIFDCDGVLVDSESLKFQAWQAALKPYGFCLTAQMYKPWVGFDNQYILAHIRAQAAGAVIPDEVVANKDVIFEQLQDTGIQPIAVNVTFLKRLASAKSLLQVKLGLASSAPRKQIDKTLESLGIASVFDVVLSGQDDLMHIAAPNRSKPAPYIYESAARALSIATPRDALVFEDSSPGVLAAYRAGMVTCALPNSWTEDQNFDAASYKKDSLFDCQVMPVLELMSQQKSPDAATQMAH